MGTSFTGSRSRKVRVATCCLVAIPALAQAPMSDALRRADDGLSGGGPGRGRAQRATVVAWPPPSPLRGPLPNPPPEGEGAVRRVAGEAHSDPALRPSPSTYGGGPGRGRAQRATVVAWQSPAPLRVSLPDRPLQGEGASKRDPAPAHALFPDALRKAGDEVIEGFRTGDLAAVEGYFNPAMRRVASHERVAATAAALDATLGRLLTCGTPSVASRGDLTLVEYPCTFEHAARTLRLVWTDIGELTGYFYLQPRAIVSAAEGEEGVVVGAAGWPLPGTLRRPKTSGVAPVVVLVHGSGAHNRDETIGPNAPLRDLAAGLAARGIASLRYDKRTFALAERFDRELPDWTLDDQIVDDAVAAVVFAATRPGLGPVFVVGHSEGAWLAPRIAAGAAMRGVTVAGVVLLAGNVTPVADLIVQQYEFAARLPVPRVSQGDVDDVRSRRDHVARLVEAASQGMALPTDPLPLDIPASAWLDIARYDPAAALLAQPGLPALLVFGGRDFQVPIREKALWEARLGGRARTTLIAYPALNHLLVEGSGPMSGDEYTVPGRVSDALLDDVADWIRHPVEPAR